MERKDENGTRWKPIHGYLNRYWISEKGEVWSELRGKVLRCHKNRGGYNQVKLYLDSVGKTMEIHRIVAQEFVYRKTRAECTVNHIDGNKQNNRYSNLVWCTQAENNKHARDTGLLEPYRKYGEDIVKEAVKMYRDTQKTSREVAKIFGMSKDTLLYWNKKYGN